MAEAIVLLWLIVKACRAGTLPQLTLPCTGQQPQKLMLGSSNASMGTSR